MIDRIIAYEQGELGEADTIALFQQLINDGTAWTLQGHYGRTAEALIHAGLVTCPPEGYPKFGQWIACPDAQSVPDDIRSLACSDCGAEWFGKLGPCPRCGGEDGLDYGPVDPEVLAAVKDLHPDPDDFGKDRDSFWIGVYA